MDHTVPTGGFLPGFRVADGMGKPARHRLFDLAKQ